MEQHLLNKFLEITKTSSSLHALTLARSLIINPSTSEHTISSIFETLTLFLDLNQNPNPNVLSLHHIFSLLSDLSIHRPHLCHPIFTAVRFFCQLPNNSTRSITDSLALLVSITELDQTLLPSTAELSERLFLYLSFCPYITVRHWILKNAKRLLVRPSLLLTVLLGFTKDPYPYIRRVALDGLSDSVVSEDHGMIEGCYSGAVELLFDMEDSVRRSAIRAISDWGQLLVASSEGESKRYSTDTLFVQLCSMVRDMSMDVRIEAFDALGKIQMVSEDILLQTLSKKVLPIIKENKYPGYYIDISASNSAGAFVHGLEDEYYEVRRSACSSLCTLSICSANFACKALNLLMDVLNDDSMVVRLQALETMQHMAKSGHLMVQEEHMHMFLGTLLDTSSSIRSAARKILRLTKLNTSAMFKLCIDGLVTSLELNPQDEADVFSALFHIGRNYGSFATRIFQEVSQDIHLFFEGKFGFDSPKTVSMLVLAISAPLSSEKHISRIPPGIFSYAVTLLGRISCGLADVMDQDTLLSYLCSCSRSTFVSASEFFKGVDPVVPAVDCQLDVNDEGKALVKLIIGKVIDIWPLIRLGCVAEVLRILRRWKEELENFTAKVPPQSAGELVFTVKYLRVMKLLGKVWTHFMSPRKLHIIGTGDLGINLGKLDKILGEMRHTFIGLNKEAELQVLELILLTCTIKLSTLGGPCFHQSTLKKLYSTISLVDLLLEEKSIEPSSFLINLKERLHEFSISSDGVSDGLFRFKGLLEFFSLPNIVLSVGPKHVMAELDVVGNDSEKPISYVSGLPVGIPLQTTLYNVVSDNRMWLRMTINKNSDQFVYLDLNEYGGCDTIKKFTFVAPFYGTPETSYFTLKVSIGMECLSEDAELLLRNFRGPKHGLVYLCKEKEVYLSRLSNSCKPSVV